MRRWSSSFVSQFLVVGFVAGAVPFAAAQTGTPDEDAHLTVLTAAPSSADLAAEHRYLELAEAGVQDEPSSTAEEAAIALADSLGAVPVSDLEGSATCPTSKLTVSWSAPGPEYLHGAFVTPLGPAPGPDTDEVNGVVLCEGYPYAFMGFEAARTGAAWDVVAVPYLGADDGHEPANDDADAHDEEPADDHEHDEEEPAPATPRIDVPVADLGPIEGYAAYEPQRICHATAKPGTDALRRLLTGHYPSTRNLGIVRGCSIGGRSEHKEGRAFDWGAYAHREVERKSADDLITRLLATDEAGNRHALARRMGVMYIIWNQRIWSAYRYDAGWRPYSGRSPHTDHVHISLSWDGAMARTSFWTANGIEALFGTPAGATLAAAKPVDGAPAPANDEAHHGERNDRPEASDEATEEARAERDERREEYEQRLEEWREARERRREEREERRAAGRPIDRESETEVAAREAEEAAEEALEALKEAEEDTEHAERRAQREADRAARKAEWEAERERRQQAREDRKAERQAEREERRQEREQRRAEERAAREQRETERQAERESEREQRRQEREERQAEKQRQREERKQQREAERAERAEQKEAERERRRQEREERRAEKERQREERQRQRDEERERRRQEREERQAEKERQREERRQREEAPPAPVEEAPAPETETPDA